MIAYLGQPDSPFLMGEAVLAATFDECRYPVAADDEFRFCSEPVAIRLDGRRSSYCSKCRRLAFRRTRQQSGGLA